MRKRPGGGFTLLELLTAIAIIAALAALLAPALHRARVKACVVRTKATMAAIEAALSMYESDFGDYPASQGGTKDLVTLLRGPVDSQRWKGPYLRLKREDLDGDGEVIDAWGNKIVYRYPQEESQDVPFVLRSAGPDRRTETKDDIGNW